LFVCICTSVSRFLLLIHEFIGHGLTALLIGGKIKSFHMFLFWGGWIQPIYSQDLTPLQRLFVSMGGITTELVVGSCSLILMKRFVKQPNLSIWLMGIGATSIIHALAYLSTGAFHGTGDGWVIFTLFPDWRLSVSLVSAVILLASCLILTKKAVRLVGHLISPSTPTNLFGSIAFALLVTATIQGSLLLVERAYTETSSYEETVYKTMPERHAQAELREYIETKHPTKEQIELKKVELAEKNQEFPFRIILFSICLIVIGIGGFLGCRGLENDVIPKLTYGKLRVPGVIAISSLLTIVVINFLTTFL
jgi:hypothetical protein